MSVKINTKNYEDVISNVLVDDRENKRVEYALKQYSALNPLKAHLPYGDYIFVGYNGIKVVWEYKTGADFLSSIQDNHLHNQVYEMITEENYTFVIIECESMIDELDKLSYHRGVSMGLPQIDGEIAEYCTVSTVLQAQTQYHAFDLMMRCSGKIIQEKPYRWKFGKKSTNQALNWLSAMKGLDKFAEKITRELDLHTLEDILELSEEKLTNIDGIGKKKAEMIMKNIRRS